MQSRRHHADHTNYPDQPLPGETFGFAANQSFPNLCWAAWRVVWSAAPITVHESPAWRALTASPSTIVTQPRARQSAHVAGTCARGRRNITESRLRAFLSWCRRRELDPLAAQRPQIGVCQGGYSRWAFLALCS